MQRGSETVLGNTANEREVFLRNECMNLAIEDVKQTVVVGFQSILWRHQYRKKNADANRIDRARAEERKKNGLPTEYYCKASLAKVKVRRYFRPEDISVEKACILL
ncbi:hypothetical protein M0R45_016444 [Rubus argutus]|uniref:Uncharacterized protein n=1 Tax=Rubus argutus TaxID=59490 RepID=A0AAW1XSK2_RUBAR